MQASRGATASRSTDRFDRCFGESCIHAARDGDDDERLVAAVRGGDDRGFELLFERYRAAIGAYVASLVRDRGDSEDITQEVFISALRSLRTSDRPVVFKPWIYEIARNACIDRHRRTRRRDEIASGTSSQLDTDPSRLVAARAAPEVVNETRERFAELVEALIEMPAVDRQLLVMREFEGRSYREIVELSGLSAPAVESALFRARRRLIERTAAQSEPEADDAGAPRPHVLADSRPAAPQQLRRATRLPAAGASSTS
jgi:RNA polymerase sigma factor (sigma-70 family)